MSRAALGQFASRLAYSVAELGTVRQKGPRQVRSVKAQARRGGTRAQTVGFRPLIVAIHTSGNASWLLRACAVGRATGPSGAPATLVRCQIPWTRAGLDAVDRIPRGDPLPVSNPGLLFVSSEHLT